MKATKLLSISLVSAIVLATAFFVVYRHRQTPATNKGPMESRQQEGPMALSGKEQTYIVVADYVFIRRDPNVRLPEEDLSYKELEAKNPRDLAPCLYYGESVMGQADPTHPDVITLRAPAQGYAEAKKFWLQPPLDAVETSRYMSLRDSVKVHVVPDKGSKETLSLKQGEVVEADGKLNINNTSWIRATFNPENRPRHGFILASDLVPLIAGKVDESHVALEEIPSSIRDSYLSLAVKEKRKLSNDGFYIEEIPPLDHIETDDMADLYQGIDAGRQFFITSDLYLHAFHLIFDRMLQDMEQVKIYPRASSMAANLAKAAEEEFKIHGSLSPLLKEALLHNLMYFTVAARLFDPKFVSSETISADVNAFVKSIQNASGPIPSLMHQVPLGKEDFTQYKVRGHYEKNETLRRYFRGVMWFGQHSFLLSDKSRTISAILIPGLVKKANEMENVDRLNGLFSYLVGQEDNYTLSGYRKVNKEVFGTETPTAKDLSVDLEGKLDVFQKAATRLLPAPKIVSMQTGLNKTPEERLRMTAGFKFLGQRFTWDAYIFNQLTSPSVGTNENPRNLPSALDAMMLIGSQAARSLQQKEQKEHHWVNYDEQIAKVQREVDGQLEKRSTFYDDWLYSLSTLFPPLRSRQLFSLSEPWPYKSLNASVASWTELKHDTILYSKQSYAEAGEGAEFEIPPYQAPDPKGYLEPNPLFFNQIVKLAEGIVTRLKASDFITEEYLDKWEQFKGLAQRAGQIAEKEVKGESITREDYQWIREVGNAWNRGLLLPRDAGDIIETKDLQMALIADVATDAVFGRVLEVGTGVPQRMVVVCKDAYGGTRLTVGYVYSWYEFSSDKRWTDTEWKEVVYGPRGKERAALGTRLPDWYDTFRK
jgi:hypothetical protein